MSLNKSAYLIRDYENIRNILRDIYIFGCFSRDDYIEKRGISGRKYDKEQQRISAYLPQSFIQKRRVDKKVLLYCRYNPNEGSDNYLAETYKNKSFTALDVMSFFFVQQLINNKAGMTASEILDELPQFNDDAVFTKDNLRIKLEELVLKGFLDTRKKGRNIVYFLKEDIFDEFTNEELIDIYIYLEFMKNTSPIEMPYNFLSEKLSLYINCVRDLALPTLDYFTYKHNHLFNVLDNDILLELLKAKNSGKDIRVCFVEKKEPLVLIPYEIIHDCVYGRQYVYGFDRTHSIKTVIRIDRISSAILGHDLDKSESIAFSKAQECSKECWCTSGVGKPLSEIVIQFYFDEINEPYILKRIKVEGHNGSLKKIKPNVYEYRLTVRDPNEMIPWIRSFGERAKVISSGESHTELLISEDWKRALEKYDSI